MKNPIILAALLLFPFTHLFAATTPGGVYEVEVLVFQNILPDLEGNELWSQDRINPEVEVLENATRISGEPDPDSDLSKAAERLSEQSDYRILTHKQWVQNADARTDAEIIRISSENGELDGTLKFYMSRFLHLDLNLLYVEPKSDDIYGINYQFSGTDNILHQIKDNRRIRSVDVQYFDHPKFGVLVQVKPLEVDTN